MSATPLAARCGAPHRERGWGLFERPHMVHYKRTSPVFAVPRFFFTRPPPYIRRPAWVPVFRRELSRFPLLGINFCASNAYFRSILSDKHKLDRQRMQIFTIGHVFRA